MRTALLLALLAIGVLCSVLPKGAVYLGNGRYSYSTQPKSRPIRKSINNRSPFEEASDNRAEHPKCTGSAYFCGTSSKPMSDKNLIKYIAHVIRMNPKDVEQKEVELAAKLSKDVLKKLSQALKPTGARPFVAAREHDDDEDLSDKSGPVGQKNSNKDKSMSEKLNIDWKKVFPPSQTRPYIGRDRDEDEDLSDKSGPVGQKNSNKDHSMADKKIPTVGQFIGITRVEESYSDLNIVHKRYNLDRPFARQKTKPTAAPVDTMIVGSIRMSPKGAEHNEEDLSDRHRTPVIRERKIASREESLSEASRGRNAYKTNRVRRPLLLERLDNEEKSMRDVQERPLMRFRLKARRCRDRTGTLQQRRVNEDEDLSDHRSSHKKPHYHKTSAVPPKVHPYETLKPTRRPVTFEPHKIGELSDPIFKWKKHMRDHFRGPTSFAKNRRDPWGDIGDDEEMVDRYPIRNRIDPFQGKSKASKADTKIEAESEQGLLGNMNTKNNNSPFEPESEQTYYGKKGGPATKVPEVESDSEKSKNGVWVPSKKDLEKMRKIQQFK